MANVLDPLSLLMGWKAGNWIARQRGAKKQPVAYLYNGVRLPALPECDRVAYPYCYLLTDDFGGSLLRFTTDQGYINDSDYDITVLQFQTGGGYMLYYCNPSEGYKEWDNASVGTWNDGNSGGSILKIEWANFDILNEDGTLYLAASEPVPVYA